MIRFILASLFLALAIVLQFWFASFGVYINVILASLMTFAFLFDIWDLVIFILAAIFIINWQPTFSLEIALFIALPLLAYSINRYSSTEPWVASLTSILVGLVILYLAVAPGLFFSEWKVFVTDLLACLIFSSVAFGALNRRESR